MIAELDAMTLEHLGMMAIMVVVAVAFGLTMGRGKQTYSYAHFNKDGMNTTVFSVQAKNQEQAIIQAQKIVRDQYDSGYAASLFFWQV